ncbi:accessory gene regulator B family protein [Clostridium sp.]|uniref:accessory gene regulator ArgB-like protein n=1 Tax=Clostridium sp. TaxID=1506 RepID=UPI002FCA1758
MERICNSIAEKISMELNFDSDRKEVIAYGLFALLQMILSILLVIVFGSLFNVVIEAVIISFTASILRKYSGGVHASSPSKCLVIGTISCIGQAILIKILVMQSINLNLVLFLGTITFLWSYYMIYKLAPVGSLEKPIKSEEKRKRMRKVSIVILSVYLILVIVSIATYSYFHEMVALKYCLCIYIGILWQVFTITTYGNLMIRKIDTFFTHILKL